MERKQLVSDDPAEIHHLTRGLDYAILMMAVHSAIQVFNPSTIVSTDGLYPCRRYVYAGALIVPVIMAALAFINPRWAFVSQGAFCTLPIRPFWYRLALTWVPRYMIVLTIIGLAIAIYAHVGFQFCRYPDIDSSFQSLNTLDGSATTTVDTRDDSNMEDITFELTGVQPRPQPQRRKSSIGHDLFTAQRRLSTTLPLSPSSHIPQRVSLESGMSPTLPEHIFSLHRSRLDAARPSLVAIHSGRSINDPVSPYDQPLRNALRDPIPSIPPKILTPSSSAQVSLAHQRQRIHRQLRFMFIYPLAYTLMWLIPFVMHCMSYWDEYAMRPVEFLRVGSSVCIALMGFVDAFIFSLREKPWRGMYRSDGTFWGSFGFARRALGNVHVAPDGTEVRHSLSAQPRRRGSQSYRSSASGDYAKIAAEQARQRLELEREERLRALGERPSRDSRATLSWDYGRRDAAHLAGFAGEPGDGKVYDDTGLRDDTVERRPHQRKK